MSELCELNKKQEKRWQYESEVITKYTKIRQPMQNRKHWTALAGYGKCKMKNAKKKLEKSSWQKVVGCGRVNKLSREREW